MCLDSVKIVCLLAQFDILSRLFPLHPLPHLWKHIHADRHVKVEKALFYRYILYDCRIGAAISNNKRSSARRAYHIKI